MTPFLRRFAKPAIVAWLGSTCMALAQPVLTVERNGSAMVPDETVQAGTIVTTMNWTYEFKLTNTGNQTLTPISLTNRIGCSTNVSPPSSLAPGQSATMSMRINTTEVGPFDASFVISSNSASQPAYKINFAGTSTTVVAPVFSSPSDVPYPGGGILGSGHTFGPVTLLFAPQPGTVLTAVQNIGFDRRFQNLPDGSIVTADFEGETYRFLAGYQGGTTAGLTLTLLGDGVLARTYAVSNTPRSLAMEGDGSFRHGLARYDGAGEPDPAYQASPNLGSPVFLTLLNGDIYHATTFSEDPQLVRLRIDGSRDLSFNAPINGYVGTMASLPDGRIMVGGGFNTVSGQTRKGIARLHPDGSVDTSFAPQVNPTSHQIKALAVQADGKIVVATNYSFNPSTDLMRFLPDGTVDATFTLNSVLVNRLLIQPDGKIVILYNSTKSIMRLHADGTVDSGFTATVEGMVEDIALQADGKLLICGSFTKVGNHPCSGVARLHPDGSPDATFAGRTGSGASQILINGKNQIFVAGDISSVNGVSVQKYNAVAELTNSTASTELQQINANTIRWMRQGGAAELHWVKADLLPEGGAPASLGMAQRIAGGWEITSPTPISNATLRLYGPSIHASGMAVMVKEDFKVGTVSPNVEVTRDGLVLSTTVANDLGAYPAGTERTFTLKIRNNGAGALAEPVVSIESAHATDFSIIQSSPTPLAAGEERAFILKLTLNGSGTRTAQLTVRSSDPGVPAHVIPLSMETHNTLNPVFNSATDVALTSLTFNPALSNLGTITLGFAPAPGTVLKLVETSGPTITGRFMDRAERPYVSAVYNGVTYWFAVEYIGSSINLRALRVGDPAPDFFVSADSGTQYAAGGLGIALQPDGKALVSGGFQTIGGKPHTRIVRLHPDGTVDDSFSAHINAASECILVLDDGRIIVDGYYYEPDSDFHDTIICLNPDGSRVESFKPDLYTGENQYAMANRLVQLKSGKILIGGRFHFVDGVPRKHLALLNPDGSLDESFNANLEGQSPNLGHIYSLAQQADGKILVGGSFGSVGGATRYCLARLNADGTLDTAFNPILGPNTTNTNGDAFGTRVSAIAQLPNGKILIGGEFSTVNTRGKTRVALLNEDGTLDESFTISSVSQPVTSFAVQEDGTIVMAGPSVFRRILPTGQTATGYSPNFTSNGGINGLALDHEGNLWVTGTLTIPGGWPAQPVLKLQNLPGTMDFRIENGNTAFWEVSGTAPALRDVKFEVSTDGGAAWTSLGAGTKVTGGWSLANLTLPPSGFIRAKGDAIITNRGGAMLEETILFGRQPTKLEEWRMEQFGSFTNQRTGADLADADKDGVANLMEYAFNLDPQDSSSAQVPAWTNDNSQFEINFTPPANVEGVSYGVEWSSTMNPSDWQDVSNQGTGGGHRYVVPKDATPLKFMRVKVTNMGSVPPP